MGVVGKAQDAGCAFSPADKRPVPVEFPILAVSARKSPVEGDAVGDGGHGEDAVAKRPVAVVIFDNAADSVSARISGIVPRAVVVDGPVEELMVAVAGNVVLIENIRQSHLAGTDFEAPNGHLRGKRKVVAIGFLHFIGQADGLVDFTAREIGSGSEIWIAHDIEVGKAGEAESFAQAASSCAFKVGDEIGVVPQIAVRLIPGEERAQQRGLIFRGVVKAVWPMIRGMESRIGLKDDVDLSGYPVRSCLAVREHGEVWIRRLRRRGRRFLSWRRRRLRRSDAGCGEP